jgi:glycerol-3-phosphate O-acyltransferase/dihydroxyacetone phosphate acyltransferase
MPSLLATALTRIALRASRVFYAIERVGPPFPPGPLLVTANHPNSLMDAIVLFTVAGRPLRPLAKAPLFDQPVIGHVLRGLGGLPVYRRQDDPALMERNETTFDAAVEALGAGAAVLIFPEGKSHSEPGLVELRTGAARIAFRAEERAGFCLGLRVLPVGLAYERKHLFRGRVAVLVGAPLEVAAWREAYARDPVAAVRELTDAIAAALERVVVRLSGWEDWPVVEAAQRIYLHEKGVTGARETPGPGTALDVVRRFAQGLAWLRAAYPERAERLARAVRTYASRTARLGVRRGDVPQAYRFWPSATYALRLAAPLVALTPLAAAGAVAWALPYRVPRLAVRLLRPEFEAVATVKFVSGLAAFAAFYAAYLGLAGYATLPWPVVAALAAGLPACGLAALEWHRRAAQFREDARVLWRALRRRNLREQLRRRRAALVAEFEALAAEWEAEERRRSG